MFAFPPSVKIFVVPGVTDMRKSFDGLAAIVRDTLRADPLSGHVFVFANRRRDRLKMLIWDRSGFWLCAKRLERGTFAWPAASPGIVKVIMSSGELAAMLDGIDLSRARRRDWFSKMPA